MYARLTKRAWLGLSSLNAALFRGDAEGRIRQSVIEENLLAGVRKKMDGFLEELGF